MIKKISRRKTLERFPKFPTSDVLKDEYYYPKCFRDYALTFESKSIKGHIKQLSAEVANLIAAYDVKEVIFLGDCSIAWRRFINEYKPANDADSYLALNNIGTRFNGGLIVDEPELKTFIMHLFWLTRCNAALPYIYFSDRDQNFIGNICKYGNLHISTLNKKTDNTLKDFLGGSSFKILTGSMCSDQFSTTGAIAGRRLKV